MIVALVAVLSVIVVALVIPMITVGLMKHLGILPIVTLAGDGGKKQTGGKEVNGFHLRRV